MIKRAILAIGIATMLAIVTIATSEPLLPSFTDDWTCEDAKELRKVARDLNLEGKEMFEKSSGILALRFLGGIGDLTYEVYRLSDRFVTFRCSES